MSDLLDMIRDAKGRNEQSEAEKAKAAALKEETEKQATRTAFEKLLYHVLGNEVLVRLENKSWHSKSSNLCILMFETMGHSFNLEQLSLDTVELTPRHSGPPAWNRRQIDLSKTNARDRFLLCLGEMLNVG